MKAKANLTTEKPKLENIVITLSPREAYTLCMAMGCSTRESIMRVLECANNSTETYFKRHAYFESLGSTLLRADADNLLMLYRVLCEAFEDARSKGVE